MDFTLEKYREFLKSLNEHNAVKIKHDVDLRPNSSLRVAKIEAEMGIKTTYYFRIVKKSYDERVIQQIVSMGHSIGYHYENLTICKGDIEAAYYDFCHNLEIMRKIAPVSTACAHGSPISKWNNQDIWNQYDIHSLGIDYEPMLDTDFSKTLYLTDTGRRWDGYKASIRDKVPHCQDKWNKEGLSFRSTDHIILAIKNKEHPIHRKHLLINTHPQRWMPFGYGWMKETTLQMTKNTIKRIIVSTQ